MSKKVLCIELGAVYTRIVEMDYQAKKGKVYKCVEIDTPHEAVFDGCIADNATDALATTIRNALVQNKIRTKRVVFTIFSSRIINREVIIPGVKPSQIKSVVKANISEYFPIELADYKVGSVLLETFSEGENEGKHRVLVAAAEKEIIAAYEKLADALGFELVDVDYSGNSLYQASKLMTEGDDAIMVLKGEEESAVVSIMRNSTLVLQRSIPYTVGSFDTPQERRDLIESVVNSLLRVSDFYLSRNEGVKIGQIYVTGELSREHIDIERISELTQFYGTAFDVVRAVTMGGKAQHAPINIFTTAIGAGIASIGLANEKELEKHETNYAASSALMVVFAIVAIAAMVAAAVVPYELAMTEKSELERKQQLYAPAKEVYDQYMGMATLYDMVQYGNALTEHSNDGILDFLAELEEKMPRDVEITNFTSDDEACVMTMRVADKETAAGVINNLRAFNSVADVVVENINEELLDDGESRGSAQAQTQPEAEEQGGGQDADEDNEEADGEQEESSAVINNANTVCYFSVSCYYYQKTLTEPTAEAPAATTAAE